MMARLTRRKGTRLSDLSGCRTRREAPSRRRLACLPMIYSGLPLLNMASTCFSVRFGTGLRELARVAFEPAPVQPGVALVGGEKGSPRRLAHARSTAFLVELFATQLLIGKQAPDQLFDAWTHQLDEIAGQ